MSNSFNPDWPKELRTKIFDRKLKLYQEKDGMSYGTDQRRAGQIILMVDGTSWKISSRYMIDHNTYDNPEQPAMILRDGLLKRRKEKYAKKSME